MSFVCEKKKCAGCYACVDVCPVSAISIEDEMAYMNAVIDDSRCIECGRCHRVCQTNYPASLRQTIEVWQGWACEDIRAISSSGGFATAIEMTFIADGGSVASCRLCGDEYMFSLAQSDEDLDGFAGSKYVKSNPDGIYAAVRGELNAGKRVLFVGLPCQVSALRNYLGDGHLADWLYTIDLICHGTPSIKVFRKTLNEYGYELADVREVFFRENDSFGLRTDIERISPPGVVDSYLTAFLKGGSYTENCYFCHYACRKRVGDLTLGDSWGTNLKSQEASGISLALVQTEKGRALLESAGLELLPVDYENAVAHNHQLERPSTMDEGHDRFFGTLLAGGSVRSASRRAYPRYRFKQSAKAVLATLGITRGGGTPSA